MSIAACRNLSTGLVSGVTTTWGLWNSATSSFYDVYSLNTVGNMSGLQEFDDNKVITEAGLEPLTAEQD